MAPAPSGPNSAPASRVNLRRLVTLRSIAILGQLLTVVVAAWYLDMRLPLLPIALVLGAFAAFNAWTWTLVAKRRAIDHRAFFLQLCVDVAELTAMLYLAGGAYNPFTGLYLIPLAIAATVLPVRYTWAIALLAIVCYSALVPFHVPLPAYHAGGDFQLHVIGMWLGFILSAGLVAYFVVGMGRTLRGHERCLARAREQALRDERLVAVGTQAASAAHALGTPLNTIDLLADELQQQVQPGDAQARDVLKTLRAQVDRCKKTLTQMSADAGNLQASVGSAMPVDAYIEGLVADWRKRHPAAMLRMAFRCKGPVPRVLADRLLSQALCNLLDNAVEVSPGDIALDAAWDVGSLDLEIRDRGPGLSREAIRHVGRTPYTEKQKGLGLGLFLSHAIIERFGGKVHLFERSGGGVVTRVKLPLALPGTA